MSEYLIQPYRSENFSSLHKLFKSSFGVDVDFESFRKKYDTTRIGGEAISYVAIDKQTNEVVSHFAALPLTAIVNGELIVATQSSDAMTDEGHRKKGLFKQLAEKVHQECATKGISLMISQPNNASHHSFLNVFHFNHIDDIIRWDLKLKIKTAPLAKILRPSRFAILYGRYCSFILKKYKTVQPSSLINPLATNDIRIFRNQEYLDYKASKDKHFLKIHDALFWIKLTDVLWIGEVYDYQKVTLPVLKKLKRLAFFLGYNTISFHLNEKVPKPRFLDHFKRYNSEPSTVYYIDKRYAGFNVILTGADFDTW